VSPAAIEACRIVSRIRAKELKEVWTKDLDENLAQQTDEILYPGMMFRLAKDRMESTELWKIVEKMPKGGIPFLSLKIDI
jgi:adenosine deaminase CECR1